MSLPTCTFSPQKNLHIVCDRVAKTNVFHLSIDLKPEEHTDNLPHLEERSNYQVSYLLPNPTQKSPTYVTKTPKSMHFITTEEYRKCTGVGSSKITSCTYHILAIL